MKKLLLLLLLLSQISIAQQPRIYYTDYGETINSTSLSGDDDNVILTSFNTPVGVSFYNDKLYVADDNLVNRTYRFNTDGTSGKIIHDETVGAIKPTSVAGFNNELYFIDNNFIRKSDINGENVVDILELTSTPVKGKIIVSNNKIYWNAGSALRVVDIDGTNETIVTDNGTTFRGFWIEGDEIFYIVDGFIVKSFLDGSNEITLLSPSSPNVSSPQDLTILDGKIYYTDTGLDAIMRSNLDGSNSETVYSIPGLANPLGIAGHNGFIYFSDSYIGARNISRISTNSTNFEVILGDEFSSVSNLAFNNDELFFIDNYIKKSNLDGEMISTISASNDFIMDTKISETNEIYFASFNTIIKTPVDNYNPQIIINIQSSEININSLAIYGDFIYWIEDNNGSSGIYRSIIDGTNIENILSDTVTLSNLEIYNDKLYWTRGSQQNILIQSDIDGSNQQTVLSANGTINDFELYNDLIYFGLSRLDNTNALATIEIDGNVDSSNAQILKELPSGIRIKIYEPENNTSADDYNALVALYNNTNGANWTNTWDLNADISTFYGVTLDANNRVVGISLENNNLVGTLPAEIGDLSNLDALSLQSNQLSGLIPSELSNLSNLQNLILYDNQLSGNIPSTLGSINSLLFLELSSNSLNGSIPPELGNLSNLSFLNLNSNQLSGSIPSELGNLSNLTILAIQDNQLTGSIPPELGNLTNITGIGFKGNQLTGNIPPELGNLSALTILSLFDNQLTGNIPPELGNLTNLQTLSLSINELTGSIPSELSNLGNSLTRLSLDNNQLTGDIPVELGNLSILQRLSLWENQLTGDIPIELGNLIGLSELFLARNNLSGTIPSQLGNLTSLTGLTLNNNNFMGNIPGELGNLVNLNFLTLQNNQLEGMIPMELGNLLSLETLFLNNNNLSLIPEQLNFLSSNLNSLNISNNNFIFLDLEIIYTQFQTINNFIYAPQNRFGNPSNLVTTDEGMSTTLGSLFTTYASDNNTYQWFKDNIAINGATNPEYEITNASESDEGVYILRVNNTGITDLELESDPVTVNVNLSLGINDSVYDAIKMYPNPTSHIFNIDISESTVLQKIDIYNNLGQHVYSTKNSIIDISDFSLGTYFVEIKTDIGKVTKKLIVN